MDLAFIHLTAAISVDPVAARHQPDDIPVVKSNISNIFKKFITKTVY